MHKKFEKPILVTQAALPSKEKYFERIASIWETKWLTNMGPLHTQLETELKTFLNCSNLTLFTNGHMALDSALRVHKFKPGSEVITTPFTFVSTTHAIAMNNLVPVFCDIKQSDYTIDEDKIESLITEKTVAILAVHVYGYPCNIEKIEKVAKKHNLIVIYDAAHAFGVSYKGENIANFGDISMFSFHATKVFNCAEGGALVYGKDAYKKPLDLSKNFGIEGPEDIVDVAFNAKMSEFHAAMGLENLHSVHDFISKRKQLHELYTKQLSSIEGFVLKEIGSEVVHNYAYFPVLIKPEAAKKTRDELHQYLAQYNVHTRKYFYPLTSNIKAYEGVKAQVPTAQYVADNILCLPLSDGLTLDEAKIICEMILGFYGEAEQ